MTRYVVSSSSNPLSTALFNPDSRRAPQYIPKLLVATSSPATNLLQLPHHVAPVSPRRHIVQRICTKPTTTVYFGRNSLREGTCLSSEEAQAPTIAVRTPERAIASAQSERRGEETRSQENDEDEETEERASYRVLVKPGRLSTSRQF